MPPGNLLPSWNLCACPPPAPLLGSSVCTALLSGSTQKGTAETGVGLRRGRGSPFTEHPLQPWILGQPVPTLCAESHPIWAPSLLARLAPPALRSRPRRRWKQLLCFLGTTLQPSTPRCLSMTSWPGGIWAAHTHVALPLLGHQISRENSTRPPHQEERAVGFQAGAAKTYFPKQTSGHVVPQRISLPSSVQGSLWKFSDQDSTLPGAFQSLRPECLKSRLSRHIGKLCAGGQASLRGKEGSVGTSTLHEAIPNTPASPLSARKGN